MADLNLYEIYTSFIIGEQSRVVLLKRRLMISVSVSSVVGSNVSDTSLVSGHISYTFKQSLWANHRPDDVVLHRLPEGPEMASGTCASNLLCRLR